MPRIPALLTPLLAAASCAAGTLPTPVTPPPAPFGATPSALQMKWHENPFYAFVHFGPNTFTNREWGFGDEDPARFNPSAFDARQIVAAAKAGGMSGLIFTAKHHDGLCLWPTRSTGHNISKTPFRAGKGDMVREFADACRAEGLRYGVYVSPWDRNHPEYGNPGYVQAYHRQITELVSDYGPLFEMWFDGACGGDGWYGGKKGSRKIDYNGYYGWKRIREIIRARQPDCAIWGAQYKENGKIVYADARWGGSERGIVGDPCWNTLGADTNPDDEKVWHHGTKNGAMWCGAEGDVSIRPGWFWHERENTAVKTPAQLWQIYLQSIGRGANLILNLPPDKRGILHENDVASLRAFGDFLHAAFAENLAKDAAFSASNIRAGDPGRGPARLVDDDRWSAWCTDDTVTTPSVEITLPQPATFNLVRLREDIRLGQRIRGVELDVFENGAWRRIARAHAVGACRLWAVPACTASKLRLRVTDAAACPALSDFGLFLAPEPPALDFSGKLKAQDRTGWTIACDFPGNDNARNAIDGNPATLWNTHGASGESGFPVALSLDLGKVRTLKGFTALPRQDGTAHGVVDRYRVETSLDGKTWTKAAEGEFANIRANPVEQTVLFDAPVKARHLRITALRCLEKNHASFAEIGIVE